MPDQARTLAQVSEGALLAEIFPLFAGGPGMPVGPGDDAAVLATGSRTVATTDTMVRGRDWVDEWSSGADVAAKALTQNLADVAAMGGRPTAVLVALMADPAVSVDWVLDFARELGARAAEAGVAVAGGDLSSAPTGVLAVAVTALGELPGTAVLRSGARPGDVVAVCGTLGRSAAGLELLRSGTGAGAVAADCVAHHLRPTTPLSAGPQAAASGATAMLDVSDGLLRDGSRLAAASGVRLALDSALLAPDVDVLREVVGDGALECVLAGGEEHSLLATFRGELPAGWRALGRVDEGEGVTLDGEPQQPRGWDHFAG
ncbi:thiamine-phosphate kinase [Pedococcus sp. NPDC057267]|uniref:thiamine-phosphate kinase n=1 Tax=Pedococcus sp. NPDC057267 TaxID=3346077 RepID=UPI00362557C6